MRDLVLLERCRPGNGSGIGLAARGRLEKRGKAWNFAAAGAIPQRNRI